MVVLMKFILSTLIKLSCMVVIFFSTFQVVLAEESDLINIKNVIVECDLKEFCRPYRNKLHRLLVGVQTIDEINTKIKLVVLDDSINKFYFEIDQAKGLISIAIGQKRKINSIEFESLIESSEIETLKKFLPFEEGSYYSADLIQESKQIIVKNLKEKGHDGISVAIQVEEDGNEVDIFFRVKASRVLRLNKIEIFSDNLFMKNILGKRLAKFVKRPWNKLRFKVEVEQIKKDLIEDGFYDSSVNLRDVIYQKKQGGVDVSLEYNIGKRSLLYFYGNSLYTTQDLRRSIREVIKGRVGEIRNRDISEGLEKIYKSRGHYNIKVGITRQSGIDGSQVNYENLYVTVGEGNKISINKIRFIGNVKYSNDFIKDFYYEKASTLLKRHFLDEASLSQFTGILKNKYLQDGYIYIDVEDYQMTKSPDGVDIDFYINEGPQTIIKEINLGNINEPGQVKKIKSAINNKQGRPLNITKLEDDFKRALKVVQNDGYFYAKIKNLRPSDIVKYSSGYKEASINLDFYLGKKIIYKDVILIGNRKTSDQVVLRLINLEKGDVLRRDDLVSIRQRIIETGLFSSVIVTPLTRESVKKGVSKSNILIRLKEKDFGKGEVALGYRTDIGVKFSTAVSYNNLMGMNRSVVFKAQTNQRLDFSNLDERRRIEQNRILEYQFKLSYIEPYLLWKDLEFDFSSSLRRQRFFAFDAIILRLAPQIYKSWTKHIGTSLKYQFEKIRPFDASQEQDRSQFRIGSLTPGISFDYRDNPVFPRSGAFFGLSWEFANPGLGSNEDDDLTVSYHKLVSRNRAYFDVRKDLIFAMSFSFGFQKNFANEVKRDANGNTSLDEDSNIRTTGFIPSIKVFRLDGVDQLRGLSENEANKLYSGENIGELIIRDKAYFSLLKLELRYLISDTTILAPFFDAGRVYVNKFLPLRARTSAGLSFKFLTPVGTLDLDYGVKLLRKRDDNNEQEKFGRFHLSIGLF
jgi:outer membrane protein insertion porin family